MAGDYVRAVEKWHLHLSWPQRISREIETDGKKSRKVSHWVVRAPSPSKILQAAYGNAVESNKELRKSLNERLLPCIAEGRPLPRDIVDLAIRRASNRNIKRLSEQYSTPARELNAWLSDLSVACSLYRGFHHPDRQPDPKKRRNYVMSLETQYASRDYLFGRLLAVAERIEEMAMFVAREPSRSTHASRLMQRFADCPASTWLNIRKALVPYQQRLRNKLPPLEAAYNKLLDDICDAFNREDFVSDRRLSGEYLLGFHCQRKWLRDHKLEKGQWVTKSPEESDMTEQEGDE